MKILQRLTMLAVAIPFIGLAHAKDLTANVPFSIQLPKGDTLHATYNMGTQQIIKCNSNPQDVRLTLQVVYKSALQTVALPGAILKDTMKETRGIYADPQGTLAVSNEVLDQVTAECHYAPIGG